MTDTPEQAHLREHLREIRKASHAVGKDIAIHVSDLDTKIDRLGAKIGKEAKYAAWELEDDLGSLERSLASDIRSIPGKVRDGAEAAGSAVAGAVSGAASWTAEEISGAGKRAAQGTKNALASAAGVRRTPMKEWHSPGARRAPPPDEES
jgi:hypothetical protein